MVWLVRSKAGRSAVGDVVVQKLVDPSVFIPMGFGAYVDSMRTGD